MFNPFGLLHEGILVGDNRLFTAHNTLIENSNIAITGGTGAMVGLTGGTTLSGANTGVACTGCAFVDAVGINFFGVNFGFEVQNTNAVRIRNSNMTLGIRMASISGGGPVDISGNKASVGLSGNSATWGIIVASNNSNDVVIAGNEITLANAQMGIWSAFVPGVVVSGNTVSFTPLPAPPTTFSRGILVQSSQDIKVTGNMLNSTFQGGSLVSNLFTHGLRLDEVSGTVSENVMSTMDIGMYITGTCGLEEAVRNNRFVGPMSYGIYAGPSGYFGGQTCAGNLWYGNFISGYRNDNIDLSFIRVNTDQPPIYPPNPLPVVAVQTGFECLIWDGEVEERANEAGQNGADLGAMRPLGPLARPNPAGTFVHIEIPPGEGGKSLLRITDMTGKLRWSHPGALPGERLTVETADWGPGVYLLHLTDGKGKRTEKLVVAH